MGMPIYGRGFQLNNTAENGLYCPAKNGKNIFRKSSHMSSFYRNVEKRFIQSQLVEIYLRSSKLVENTSNREKLFKNNVDQ